jgi:TetR/AcrR family transcriptional regulator, copper-responsive repressor
MHGSIKKSPRPRGRPRQFDAAAVLERATGVFWSHGLSTTTLADLCAATGLVRPSIANAFGDKQDLYRLALSRFSEQVRGQVADVLASSDDLATALTRFYSAALDVYCAQSPALGCFVMCTAPVEAVAHPEVREQLSNLIADLDEVLKARFAKARRNRQLGASADAAVLGRLAQSVLHSLAIRARSGASKESLRRVARDAVNLLTRTKG